MQPRTASALNVSDLVIIFRAHSDVEASIVRGLLEAHGVPSVVASDVPHSRLSADRQHAGRSADLGQRATTPTRRGGSSRATGPSCRAAAWCGCATSSTLLQQAIDYRFRDGGLLEHAMTHTSRANEDVSGGVVDNESLEFLGDAVLGFVIADLLFREFPEFDEGQKSKIKAALVSTTTLARQAERLALGDHLLLGRGEEKTGGRRKQALLADGYEALIAAIYLDGGIEQARAFIAREFAPLLADDQPARPDRPATTSRRCRSTCSRTTTPLPEYRLAGTLGPDHRKLFQVEVVVRGEAIAAATGPSKKEAEQEAATAGAGEIRNRELGMYESESMRIPNS